jgi:hypothetical protein
MSYSPTNPNYLTIAQSMTNDGQKNVKVILDIITNIIYTLDDDGNFKELAFEVPTPTPQVYIYRALLNQTGTNAPVVTVLQNEANITPVWTYDSTGYFFLDLSSAQGFAGGSYVTFDFKNYVYHDKIGFDNIFDYGEIIIRTFSDAAGTVASNGVMQNTLFEVLIFPV